MAANKLKRIYQRSSSSIMDNFDVGPAAAITVLIAVGAILTAAVIFFIQSAPPASITISSGPEGGSFHRVAQRYAKRLESNGVKVEILTSAGSSQNLERLRDSSSGVDVALVQAGLAVADLEIRAAANSSAPLVGGAPASDPGARSSTDRLAQRERREKEIERRNSELVSLGSISQQPLLVFYRGPTMQFLTELKGRKIAVGPEGSGANQLARAVLGLNSVIDGADGTQLAPMEAEAAAKAVQMKLIDAAFIMSESASFGTLRSLTRAPGIHLFSFKQAQAYIRKLDYLNLLSLPQGGFDIGGNLPDHDVTLIGPTIDLLARQELHPAISDLLLEAATEVHSRPGMYQQRGEFPSPLEHGVKISDDANRYYKSGKSFLYRYFPYWLASLLSRILVVFLPALVLLVPIVRAIIAFFQWRVRSKIYQRYRDLVQLERACASEADPERRAGLQREFDRIESDINSMRIKGSYADQVYGLRLHVDYVRRIVGAPAYQK